MQENNLDYSGKPKDLSRKIGMNAGVENQTIRKKPAGDQRSSLLTVISQLIDISDQLIEEAEAELVKVAVLVPEVSTLKEAFTKEWPSELGTVSDKISFSQYKMFQKKHSSGAVILRTYFLKNIRSSENAAFLDIYTLIQLINGEAKRINSFVKESMRNTTGIEKGPAYRLFQDWADGALSDLNELWNYAVRKPVLSQTSVNGKSIENITAKDAKSFQAIIHGKLNATNTNISMDLAYLEKSHGDLADRFYKEFLGPAMVFKEDVSGSLEKTRSHVNTSFYGDIDSANTVYSSNLKLALADQLIRNNNYKDRVARIFTVIKDRDRNIAEINLLSTIGSEVVPQVVTHEPSEEEIALYKNYSGTTEDVFKASHAFLDDLDSPDAHPQYILKDGDTLTGNLNVGAGVKIDGVDISGHIHNGEDGSSKIDARDLVEGSLGIASIDSNEQVFTPKDLELLSSTVRLSAATALVDVTLKWKADPTNTFEFQIAPVKTHTNIGIDQVFSIIKEAPGADIPESGYSNLWSLYNSTDGDNWNYFLTTEDGGFNHGGISNGALGSRIILNTANTNNSTQTQYQSFSDADFYTDVNLDNPYIQSNLWVLRSDESIIAPAGNKVYHIDNDVITTIKTFEFTPNKAAHIYSVSIDKVNDLTYFFVKLSDYSDNPKQSRSTQVELWRVNANNSLDKIYTWNNQEGIDKVYRNEQDVYGWYTSDINDKDYSLINTGFVYGDYIYSFCLYNLLDSDFYHTPDLTIDTMPVLCRFSLVTKKKELIKAHDDSYIICFGDEKYLSPQPVVKSGVVYLPSNVVLSKETINNTTVTNSIGKIESGVFSRQYIVTPESTLVDYRGCMLDADDNLYALGIFGDSGISVGEAMGGIYSVGDI